VEVDRQIGPAIRSQRVEAEVKGQEKEEITETLSRSGVKKSMERKRRHKAWN
jgi:hypothetical protein